MGEYEVTMLYQYLFYFWLIVCIIIGAKIGIYMAKRMARKRDKRRDDMGAKFDSEELTIKVGQMLIDVLGDALDKKGFEKRMTEGVFIIDNVTILSVEGDEIKVQVEYEYGM